MNPFFFGTSKKPLFGLYHPPHAGTPARQQGVVLCYPFGMEYMRCHRAFRQLALLLSKKGFHVLRFDYYGTGDSGGDGEEVSFQQWQSDIDMAVEELKDTAAVNSVTIIGLRLGAALALNYAKQNAQAVDRVVLWDPVVRGIDYMDEVLQSNNSDLEPVKTDQSIPHGVMPSDTIGINGFPLTPLMADELAKIDLLSTATIEVKNVLSIFSHEREEFYKLGSVLSSNVENFTEKHIPSAGNWNEVDKFGGVLLPQEVIQNIVLWLTEE